MLIHLRLRYRLRRDRLMSVSIGAGLSRSPKAVGTGLSKHLVY